MIERATDAILLRRFAEGREEAAFAELVKRHGPHVRRVCRQFLRSEHDAEDVFQATFLLLSLRASDVAWRASIGGWVRDVARRLALHARSELARRGRRETPVSNLPPGWNFGDAGALPEPECPLSLFADEVERRDVRRAIDGAVDDLPGKYRDPVVLCYLQGKSNREAAVELGYPVGSISRRLVRARSLLRESLVGRGVTLGVLLALAAWIVSGPHRSVESPDRGINSRRPDLAINDKAEPASELRELLGALERKEWQGLDPARLDLGVEHAEESAERAPASVRESRRGFAAETRLAALDLADHRAEGAVAASRLLATCVRCHVALP
ncbi:RNA polymerase sigma factor [Paludisphaera mucosa]|uniref:Sigma-70 family RNA polymerase sigma factor n=1 Tax=Paludisphaera mucosa TaxID=3030827 RepID=A0ABT6F537_9BACT|nr:sigma-70 family RNA polymerase sigma factor [Paludisphaera mucosa]MDG3002693.1 sigma-70 family RNA polymerase sigma factor [Paludisphaera mucosa]